MTFGESKFFRRRFNHWFELVLADYLLLVGFAFLLGGRDGRGLGQAAEAIALEFFEHPESSGVGAVGGLIALEHSADDFFVGIGEVGDCLLGVSIDHQYAGRRAGQLILILSKTKHVVRPNSAAKTVASGTAY